MSYSKYFISILKMRKLRPREVHDLPQITNIESGKAGIQTAANAVLSHNTIYKLPLCRDTYLKKKYFTSYVLICLLPYVFDSFP